ncbi:MAG: hypothetical protein KAF91_27340 [Nostoc sp. TH1S01]|nr:hypothetical protein [Nostoc sp. TH1S01]
MGVTFSVQDIEFIPFLTPCLQKHDEGITDSGFQVIDYGSNNFQTNYEW